MNIRTLVEVATLSDDVAEKASPMPSPLRIPMRVSAAINGSSNY